MAARRGLALDSMLVPHSADVTMAMCGLMPVGRSATASPRRPALADVSAACLGGRHAYRASLAPLTLPALADLESPKRLRTTPDGGYAKVLTPQGSVGSAVGSSSSLGARRPSRLGAFAGTAKAMGGGAAASPSSTTAMWGGWRAQTGTKEPSTAPNGVKAAAPSSPPAPGATTSPCSAMAPLPEQAMLREQARVLSAPLADEFAICDAISLDDFRDLLGDELAISGIPSAEMTSEKPMPMPMRVAGGQCGTKEPASAASPRRGKRCLA